MIIYGTGRVAFRLYGNCIISGTERNGTTPFRILQEYDNLSYEFVLYVAER